jgi:hypothetical protein
MKVMMIMIKWPFDDLDGFWAWIGRNGDQIKFVLGVPSVIIAALVFLFGYYGKGVDERRKTSLDFIQRYVQGDVLSSRIKLRQIFLQPDYKEFAKIAAYDHPLTNRDKVAFLDKTLQLHHLFVVAEYFEHLTICVYSDLCDFAIVCEVLYSDLKAFGGDYLFYIDELRREERRPVGRLGEFTEKYADSQECYDNRNWTSKLLAALKEASLRRAGATHPP